MAENRTALYSAFRSFLTAPLLSGMFASLMAVVSMSGQIQAADLSCTLQTLKGASGVIGMKHSYAFTGTCSESWISSKSTGVIGGSATNSGYTFQVVGSAKWDRSTGIATEELKLTGNVTGKRSTEGTCTQDPFLGDPPDGFGTCTGVSSITQLDSGELWKSLVAQKFLFTRKVNLSVAQALSAQKPSDSPPKPPPPKSQSPSDPESAKLKALQEAAKVVSSMRPTLLNIEAEDLVSKRKFLLGAGQLSIQQMAGFGAGWSGGQLFWTGGSQGAVLDLTVEIPAAATYAIELYLTRAPDYAQLKIQVDGVDAVSIFDAYAPRVMSPAPRQIGKFSLGQGEHKISFMIVGKNPTATGYFVGIDRIRLYPVGP